MKVDGSGTVNLTKVGGGNAFPVGSPRRRVYGPLRGGTRRSLFVFPSGTGRAASQGRWPTAPRRLKLPQTLASDGAGASVTEIRTVPWLRLSIEAVLIILSILAAFAIDAWWAERQESQRLEATLMGIADGLSESRAAVERHIEVVRAGLANLDSFLAMSVDDAGQIPADETRYYLSAIQRPYTQDDNLTFLRRALDDDILRELADEEFQSALVEWREALNQLDEIDRVLSVHWPEALAVLSRHEAVGRALARSGGLAPTVEPRVMRSVRGDPAVFSIAARKAVLMRAQSDFLPRLVDAEARLLRAIQSHLSE